MVGGGDCDHEYEDEEQKTPLLKQHNSPHQNTGTVWTALAHIITGVIGSGVLSLTWSIAQLGWIGGPLALLLFAFFTLVSAYFISDVHLYLNPNNGTTTMNRSYLQAVHTILGYKNGLVCGCLVYFSVFKTGVVYTITSSISMRAIRQSNCYHEEGHDAACEFDDKYYMLLFGVIQIFTSQIPNIFHTKWLSIISAIMSFTYSFIGMGLGLAQTIGKGKIEGSISGISTTNPTQKIWLSAQALGDIAFSYTFSLILLEIQSTLKSPPSQKVTMKKASTIAVFTTTIFYLCCGASGYAAFGDLTPGNLLTGFGFYEPYWLVDFGNACIALHLVGGYQFNLFPFVLLIEGTVWTALAHIITGVIGSGVLSLTWSIAQLGWIGGPLALLLFAFFTLVSAYFISDVHLYLNPNNGTTTMNRSYLQAVHTILGYKNGLVCGCLVYFSVFKTGVVYTITSSISMRAIRQSNCYHEEGHDAACEFDDKYYMLLFGVIQIFTSQIPNIFHTKWLSIISAIMSFTYSFIGMGLGLAQTIGKGKIEGSISGISTTNPTQKIWLSAQALGDIAFSYTFSLILLEIQSTLKSPPSQKVTMKKASTIAVFTTTIFYLCCGASGYAAFGDLTPGNLLTGFGFYEPYWLVDFGNACIALHLVGGYQIYSQTLFAIVERWYAEKFPESTFAKDTRSMKVSLLPEFRLNPLRLCFRTAYVVLTVAVGMLFPYFNEVVAFAGSVIFWPLTNYFPVEMYFVQKKVVPWSGKWIVLRIYTIFCLFVIIFTLAGSIEGLIAKRFA